MRATAAGCTVAVAVATPGCRGVLLLHLVAPGSPAPRLPRLVHTTIVMTLPRLRWITSTGHPPGARQLVAQLKPSRALRST